MKKGLWLSLRRDRIKCNLYFNDVFVASIYVHHTNRVNNTILGIDLAEGMTFKIDKSLPEECSEIDDGRFNKEHYNK